MLLATSIVSQRWSKFCTRKCAVNARSGRSSVMISTQPPEVGISWKPFAGGLHFIKIMCFSDGFFVDFIISSLWRFGFHETQASRDVDLMKCKLAWIHDLKCGVPEIRHSGFPEFRQAFGRFTVTLVNQLCSLPPPL